MESVSTGKTHLRCKVIMEMLGKPKEHVEKTIRMYVDNIRNDQDLIVLNAEFSDATEKDNLWAVFSELDMVIKGIPKLIAFCFDYMPSSIQIIKPEEFMMTHSLIENFANDLQARLHNVDMVVKKLKNENEFIKKNMNTVIKNTISVSLAYGSMDKDRISKITGINILELEPFLQEMIKEKKILEENGNYRLAAKKSENAKE